MKKVFSLALFLGLLSLTGSLTAQQAQCPTCPIYPVNAKYVNGAAPGYAPSAGSGLTLNLSAGRVRCANTMTNYFGGTLTMTNSTTNYVFLDTGSSCAPSSNTSGYTATLIPIATVITSGGAIASITDDRTFGLSTAAGTGAIPTSAGVLGSDSTPSIIAASAHGVALPRKCQAASASGTAYTCSTTPTFVPAAQDEILFKADVANTGSATLNVNSSSAATIKKQGGGTNLVANDLLASQWVVLVYDGTNWQMQGQTGNASAGGTQVQVAGVNSAANANFVAAGSAGVSQTTVGGTSTVTITGVAGSAAPAVQTIGGTSYTVQNSDNTWRDKFTNASAVAVTLPQANTISVAPFVSNPIFTAPTCNPTCTTSTFSMSANNQMFIYIGWNNTTTLSTVTTSDADSCSRLTADQHSSAGGQNFAVSLWFCPAVAANASKTVSITMSGNTAMNIIGIYQYTGLTLDHAAGATDLTSVTVPVSSATDLAIGAAFTTSAAPPGWTSRTTTSFTEINTGAVSSITYVPQGCGAVCKMIAATFNQSATPVFTTGWYTILENANSSLVTVTPSTSHIIINGVSSTSLQIAKGKTCALMSDGTDYDAICWGVVENLPSPIHQTGQTAAIGTATLCAASPGACNQAGQYHVHFDFIETGTACSNVTAGSVTFLLTWTDTNATAHSAVVIPMLNQTGATSVAQGNSFTFATALANAGASGDFDISTNGTVIQYATGYTGCTTGTGTYQLDAAVTKLQY